MLAGLHYRDEIAGAGRFALPGSHTSRFSFAGFDVAFDPAHVVDRFVRSEEGCPSCLCLLQRDREEETRIGFVPEFVIAEVLEMDLLSLLDVLFDDDGLGVDVSCCEVFLLHNFGIPSRAFTSNLTLRTRLLYNLSYGDRMVRAGRVALPT